ncbi:hypothetical protein M0R88_03660 [Halorussus gelatinilyticus]|uniref:Uncharacterized protein n=1 Tax=Halorussus gelatinilyticus TaxID=2937524 RepID=A0A8U0IJC3_9EURY|nr:hypothetical protein [Halorussus gelatinilyticus]UPW01207.1 hypothetical protein M0R88_03660 [Halorussus gelatinilyticus]
MNADADRDDRSRKRSLKWTLGLVALVTVPPALQLYEDGTVSWMLLLLGVVSWAVAAGPVAASDLGRRVGSWFESIGYRGRGAVIVAFAVLVWTSLFSFDLPTVPIQSFLLGGIVGLAAAEIWRYARSE